MEKVKFIFRYKPSWGKYYTTVFSQDPQGVRIYLGVLQLTHDELAALKGIFGEGAKWIEEKR